MNYRIIVIFIITFNFGLLFTLGCSTNNLTDQQQSQEKFKLERPYPNPIELPSNYLKAINAGTRSENGAPGPNYWQNESSYKLKATLLPEQKKIYGQSIIQYQNNSPRELDYLVIELAQNLHKKGTFRKHQQEITGGIELLKVITDGVEFSELSSSTTNTAGYIINDTRMVLLLENSLTSKDLTEIEIHWTFEVPKQGAGTFNFQLPQQKSESYDLRVPHHNAGGRMGHDSENLFFIAYWYPKIAVYDDVYGWSKDPFLGNAEFYHGFADYELEITVPENWLVMASGDFLNPDEVLAGHIYERFQKASGSDEIVTVVSEADLNNATKTGNDGTLTWKFSANQVRDVAFSAMRESVWYSTRAPVGDLNGDGIINYTSIHSFFRETAPLWKNQVKYSQQAITFFSDYLAMSYPWPHMTSIEGGGIIEEGMEFPMITLMGDYETFGTQYLHFVTVHEFAHMWIPMILSTNERRYAWMDEGFTTFNTHNAMSEFYPGEFGNEDLFRHYLAITETEHEGEIMRWSDYHYPGPAFYVASYPKPASVLNALKYMIGHDLFTEAYHTFISDWAYKHPYPWDFFRTVERFSGEDLDWFWRSWYYETWTLDQAIDNVEYDGEILTVEILDYGDIPMPVPLHIVLENGTIIEEILPVHVWLTGQRIQNFTIRTDSPPAKITIDPDFNFPDSDRSNNYWNK